MTRNQRLSFAIKAAKLSQEAVGKAFGDVSQKAVSNRLLGDEIDSLSFIRTVARLTGFSFRWLADGEGSERDDDEPSFEVSEAAPNQYLSGKVIRPITVTVDRTGRELISYVPVKAYAGYRRGFGDPHYIEKLPAFSLPNIPQGKTLRMFQVDGDSMLQMGGAGLHDGDAVIGEYVEDIFSIRDNRVYVVVSTEGVLVKRVINRLTSQDKILVLKSDNKNGQYPDIIIHPKEILEVWELKAFISRQLSFSTDLWQVINDLQVEQALIKAKVDEMARGESSASKLLPESDVKPKQVPGNKGNK